jgi:hypothetical protein
LARFPDGRAFTRSGLRILTVSLEDITPLIFKLSETFHIIFNELTLKLRACLKVETASANSAIVQPLAIVVISVLIVMNPCSVPHSLFEISFIEFTV